MPNPRKHLIQSSHPHLGNSILKVMNEKKITKMALSKRLGVSYSTVSNYFKQASLQFGIVWNVGIALEYDFLGEFINYYPPQLMLNEKSKLVIENNALKEKLAEAEKTILLYKELLMK